MSLTTSRVTTTEITSPFVHTTSLMVNNHDVTDAMNYLYTITDASSLTSKLQAGSGITIANGVISAGITGSGTISGTSNQVIVTNNSGASVLSLPQNIHTGASPTFAGLTIGATDVTNSLTYLANVSNATTLASKLTAGNGISISAGSIINNGVTQLSGTSNQVNVSGSSGSITLSLPQNIHTSATPTFAGLTIGANSLTAALDFLFNVTDATTLASKLTAGTGIAISAGTITNNGMHKLTIWVSSLSCVPFVVYLVSVGNDWASLALVFALFTVLAYSVKGLRFKEKPFLDSVTSATHFVNPAIFAALLVGQNLAQPVLWQSLIAFFCWGMASHAFGAVQDVRADREGGIASIATVIGARATTRFAFGLYLAAALLMATAGWPASAAAIAAVPYLAILLPFMSITDETCEIANQGWRRFIWLNFFAGAIVTQLLIA